MLASCCISHCDLQMHHNTSCKLHGMLLQGKLEGSVSPCTKPACCRVPVQWSFAYCAARALTGSLLGYIGAHSTLCLQLPRMIAKRDENSRRTLQRALAGPWASLYNIDNVSLCSVLHASAGASGFRVHHQHRWCHTCAACIVVHVWRTHLHSPEMPACILIITTAYNPKPLPPPPYLAPTLLPSLVGMLQLRDLVAAEVAKLQVSHGT